jgi:hypothetical protein
MPFAWVQPFILAALALAGAGSPPAGTASVPASETLSYSVEWRLIHAGNARLIWGPNGKGWQTRIYLESAGLVSRLYKVNNEYSALLNEGLCVESSLLKTNEGNRRSETAVTFDSHRRKAVFLQRDLVHNSVISSSEIDIRPCEHDVIGALYTLRGMNVEPGQSVQLPVSDGKKTVMARVEAQEREVVKTDAGTFKTVRYEAFLFDNVLYRRQGRLFVWLTDDAQKMPVQVRIRLPFYIGTVTLLLEKQGNS